MTTPSSPPPAGGGARRYIGIALAGLGAAIAVSLVAALAERTGQHWLIASFGATCVLLFGVPDSVLAQPRNVIGGHCLTSLIGLLGLHLLGDGWPAVGLTCAVALMAMMLTRTVHPPAGANPIIVFMTHPGWDFLLLPTLLGAVLLMGLARLYWLTLRWLQRPTTR